MQVNVNHAEQQADEIAAALPKAKGKVLDSLMQQQDEVNARYDALIRRCAELEGELAKRRLTDTAICDILAFARDVREGIENATWQDKRRMLELLQVSLSVNDGHYHARCLLGEWSEKVLERDELERATLVCFVHGRDNWLILVTLIFRHPSTPTYRDAPGRHDPYNRPVHLLG